MNVSWLWPVLIAGLGHLAPEAGRLPLEPAARSLTDDGVPPPPPVVLTPPEGAVERSETPLISGTAEAGNRVTIWLDFNLVGAVVATEGGTWSFTPALAIGAGLHVILAEAIDEAGNSTFATAIRTFTVQPSGPATPRLLSPAGVVSTALPSITGKASSGDSVDVVLDRALAGTVRPDDAGTWSFTPSTPLADGPHTATAQARDPQLNTSPMSNPITFVVDTTAPARPVLTTPGDNEVLTTTRPAFAGTAEPGSTVWVTLDGKAGSAPASGAGKWSFTLAAELPEGPHTVTLQATDAAGNASPPLGPRAFIIQRPRSFYRSGCSAAPGEGWAWWLLLALGSLASRRRAA